MTDAAPRPERPIVAVDLGGTQVRVALFTPSGALQRRATLATDAHLGPEAVLDRLAGAVQVALDAAGGARPLGISVGVPGPTDPRRGLVYWAPNLPGWRDVPLAERLGARFGVPVLVGNDANLAALGEGRFGAGRGHRDLVYLTISTGVGSGIIVDGELLLGSAGVAAEAGHILLDPSGPPCGCGANGCLEVYASGTAIARQAATLLAEGASSRLAAHPGDLTAAVVAAAAADGDALAREVLSLAAEALGFGIVTLLHLFNPSIVILGGGVSFSGPLWWDTVRATVWKRARPIYLRDLRIAPAALGDDAGLYGAAAAFIGGAARV